ncbi:hypothetical protein D3C81_1039940 [compost metagenome]
MQHDPELAGDQRRDLDRLFALLQQFVENAKRLLQSNRSDMLHHHEHVLLRAASNKLLNCRGIDHPAGSGVQAELVRFRSQGCHLHAARGNQRLRRVASDPAAAFLHLLHDPLYELPAAQRHKGQHRTGCLNRFDDLLPLVQLLAVRHKHDHAMLSRVADIRQQRLQLMLDFAAFLAACYKQCGVTDNNQLTLYEKGHRLRFFDHDLDWGLRQIKRSQGKVLLIPIHKLLLEQAHELLNLVFLRTVTNV